MTGKKLIMDKDNREANKPLRKSVATNCSSDLPNLHPSSASASSSSPPPSCSSDNLLPNSTTSETEMLNSIAANEVRIFRNAKNRLESFRLYNWPREDIDTRDLAEAGFFLPKVRQLPDEVECIFCRVKVGNWSPGVDPFLEHLRHSPRCDFLSGYIVANVPLGGTPISDPVRGRNKRVPSLDVCGTSYNPQTHNSSSYSSSSSVVTPCFPSPFSSNFVADVTPSARSNDSVSIEPNDVPSVMSNQQYVHRPPKYPNLVTTQTRLNTYPDNWCPDICPISAYRLADAGFFYSGPLQSPLEPGRQDVILRDVVICFHCDRKVFNWSPEDEPWDEHFRLNKDCYFLQLNYKPRVSKSTSNTLPSNVQENSNTASASSTNPNPCSKYRRGEEDEGKEERNKMPSSSEEENKETENEPNKTNDPLGNVSGIKDELNNITSQEKQSKGPSSISSDESKGTCKVCYMNEVELLFLPCKHASCCGQCAASVTNCPLCRAPITSSIRIFLS